MTKNKKQNRQQKKEKKKPCLRKKSEVCLLFPNFKPVFNQTKIQKFFKIIFITKHIRKTRIFLKKKIEKK
jgi:hypothetical protein